MKQSWKPGNLLYPLPAVMLSCAREGEKPNIITLAWVGTVCSEPPMVSVSIRKERYSYDIVKESGEFVINLVTEPLCRAMDWCGARSGRDYDKFAEMHLTPLPAPHLKYAPLIAESPVGIECRVQQIVPLGSHDMFIGRIEGVQVDEALLNEKGKLELGRAGLVVYSHGVYSQIGETIGTFGYSVKKR